MAKLPQISTNQIYPQKSPGLLTSLENWPFQGYHGETKKKMEDGAQGLLLPAPSIKNWDFSAYD